MSNHRIVWLAAADARGHLVRAHLARRLLAGRGVGVDIVTTNPEGQRFLAALGTPSELLSPHYGVAFDDWQNLDRRRTEAIVARYFLQPSRALRDLRRVAHLARDAAYVVNDFHPLLLVAGHHVGRVVHLYGASLYRAIAHHFEHHAPRLLDRRFARTVDRLAARAYARVEHGLTAPAAGHFRPHDRTFVLPPLISLPRRSREEVRAALGLAPAQRLAAVYLNPHFRHGRLADALHHTLTRRGYHLHAVGEGLTSLGAFSAHDASFADVAAAADVLLAAPGMASCAQARAFGLPFVAVATDQPEQRTNLAALSASPHIATLDLLDPSARESLLSRLDLAIERATTAPRPAPQPAFQRAAHDRWSDVLAGLLAPRPTLDLSPRLVSLSSHPEV